MTHYPVTTRLWRGVKYKPTPARPLNRMLRRACDWHTAGVEECSSRPTCEDCAAYKGALERMGYGL